MGRMVRRVPMDFEWPLDKVWKGFEFPERLHETQCPNCENGFSEHAEQLHALWYGNRPFRPESTGCVPLTIDTPAVRAFAERQIERSPEYYGPGEAAIVREAQRMVTMWNGQWCHHLSQDDVDALTDADRLIEFTHDWVKGEGWQLKNPPYRPTAEEVNTWSLGGFGHDTLNAHIVIAARCKKEGFSERCGVCKGHGTIEAYEGQRADGEAWKPEEPPTGEGWQLWETVSEGSPITPVCESRDDLVEYLVNHRPARRGQEPLTRAQAEALVDAGGVTYSGVAINGKIVSGEASVLAIAEMETE